MKCPKCHYLSFEPEPRCRNCGYSFSLADEQRDVLIRGPEPAGGPFADLDLRPTPPGAIVSRDEPGPNVTTATPVAGPIGDPIRPPVGHPADVSPPRAPLPSPAPQPSPMPQPGRPAPTTELPLFVKALTAVSPEVTPQREEPLVKVPSDPRPPLSVRRKTAEGGHRQRPTPVPGEIKKLGPFDRDLLEDLQRIEHQEEHGSARPAVRPAPGAGRVGAGARAAAAAIDAVLLGTTAALVLWITLRWCDLTFARVTVLPIAPTAAFLLLVGAGYLLMFTAFGGQTLGKMALGIRVVSESDEAVSAVSLKQAVYRAVLTLPSVLVFGLGFIPALVGDERALHDRLAHTRVVRA